MTSDDLSDLKAQAAAAAEAAAAAAAQAQAAQAALEAVLKAEAATTPDTATAPASDTAVGAPAAENTAPQAEDDRAVPGPNPQALNPWVEDVRASYQFAGEALPLGALMDGGVPRPDVSIGLSLAMMNRHGLVAGATGTGKTRTLQLMTEGLSRAGVNVFATDIKGDLTGLLQPGASNDKLTARTAALGQDWQPEGFPVQLLRLGEQGEGIPVRTTVTDFGPLLLARVLELNDTQTSALELIFHWADSQELALLDLKDLRAVVDHLSSAEGKTDLAGIGGISSATAGVILRKISALSAQGGDEFFGEPAFDTSDLLRQEGTKGVISLLELPAVFNRPTLVATFVMWLLASLFETLPEVGDPDKPKLVFFFDEAHLLFDGASAAFTQEVIRTVRLIRSKGVGVFFVTQTPKDIPADVLAQLGARVQHALRAFTPADAKKLKDTVATFPTSALDLGQVLTSLGTGEAVITVLDAKGRPTQVAPTRLYAPAAVMGEAEPQLRQAAVTNSPLNATYGTRIDRESAFELLTERLAAAAEAKAREEEAEAARKEAEKLAAEQAKAAAKAERERQKELEALQRRAEKEAEAARRAEQKAAERRSRVVEDMLRSAGRTLSREITRSIFGTRRR